MSLYSINSNDIRNILERLNHKVVDTQELSKLKYEKWKVLNTLAKIDNYDFHFYIEVTRNHTNNPYTIFYFPNQSLILKDDDETEHWVSQQLANFSNMEKKEQRKEENNNMFKNFNFGPVTNPNIKISPYGIALMNKDNTYVSYNKDTKEIIDVDILNFKSDNILYKIPAAITDIKPGDVVVHNKIPMIVTMIDEKDSKFVTVDVLCGEEKIILPTKSPFGFNFITKVVSILDWMPKATEANENNPFGNLLPLMLLGDQDKDMNPFVLMMLAGESTMNNPMMLYALAASDKDNNNLLPLMLMSMNIKK